MGFLLFVYYDILLCYCKKTRSIILWSSFAITSFKEPEDTIITMQQMKSIDKPDRADIIIAMQHLRVTQTPRSLL